MARKERSIAVYDVTYSVNSTVISMPTASVVYTNTFEVGDATQLTLVTLMSSGTLNTASCVVTVEQSFKSPVIQGSWDATYTAIQTKGLATVGTYNYVTIASDILMPPVSTGYVAVPYLRFKVEGGANNSSATVKLWLCKRMEG